VTHQELHEQVAAFVDDRVDEQQYRAKVQGQIAYCPECGAAYEREVTTGTVVRERSDAAPAPDSLRRSIATELDRIDGRRGADGGRRSSGGFLGRIAARNRSPIIPSLACILFLAGAFQLWRSSTAETIVAIPKSALPPPAIASNSKAPANFFNFASATFQAIREKKLGVQVRTDDPAELAAFFKEKGVEYDVPVPHLGLPLAGGFVTAASKGGSLAHIVYSSGDRILYLLQVPYDRILKEEGVYMTRDVLDRLDAGDRIWEEPTYNTPISVGKSGTMVVAAVANVPRSEMEGLIKAR